MRDISKRVTCTFYKHVHTTGRPSTRVSAVAAVRAEADILLDTNYKKGVRAPGNVPMAAARVAVSGTLTNGTEAWWPRPFFFKL